MCRLPPELVNLILSILDATTLRSFSLLSQESRQNALGFLFSHFRLNSSNVAQCELFFAKENHHLYSQIKKLTIEANSLTLINDKVLALLVSLAPQIHTLCLDGRTFGIEGLLDVIPWSEFVSPLWNFLRENFLRSIVSLEIIELTSMPVFHVLHSCPMLQHLHIRSNEGLIPSKVEDDQIIWSSSAPKLDLSLEGFDFSDFSRRYTLAHFLKLNGKRIASLHLGSYRGNAFHSSLNFLCTFTQFITNLQHLSLGRDYFHDFNPNHHYSTWLPFAMFPQLETLSFTILFPSGASIWFDWLAGALKSSISYSKTSAIPLKKLHFTIIHLSLSPQETASLPKNFDDLANHSGLSCTVEFSVSVLEGSENIQSLFDELRVFFPSWDQSRRLKLWVQY
ncbi:hypothetical protein DL96DRAFT_1581215 [Flagelloscypha sp. PMI_526]|nr:hypothetical protein DL96DRAFT_1581215 [Flagelloscypha sp. PMI_526]